MGQTRSRSTDSETGEGDAALGGVTQFQSSAWSSFRCSTKGSTGVVVGFDHLIADLSEYLSSDRGTTAEDILCWVSHF